MDYLRSFDFDAARDLPRALRDLPGDQLHELAPLLGLPAQDAQKHLRELSGDQREEIEFALHLLHG